LTSAYKIPNFVSKNERVRIPDVDYERMQQRDNCSIKISEIVFPSEANSSEMTSGEESENSDSKKQEEEKLLPKIISKDELKAIYEQSLKELAASVAQQAYYDSLNKKKAELKDCINGVQALLDEMVTAHKQFIEEYTNELKYMAVDIAEKIILEKISEDDLILQRLVLQTVNNVKNAEWLNVEISERLVGLVDSIKKELDKPEYNGRAFVFPVAGTDSICRVTTNDGTVVSTIEVQTDNLRKTFREFEQ